MQKQNSGRIFKKGNNKKQFLGIITGILTRNYRLRKQLRSLKKLKRAECIYNQASLQASPGHIYKMEEEDDLKPLDKLKLLKGKGVVNAL